VAYVRTVKTSSGATAVQVVWSTRRGSRKIEHLGSAHDETGVTALKAAAAQRLAAGQTQLDLGLAVQSESEPLPITSSKAAQLWEALCCAYDVLGFEKAAGGDEAFRQLVLARIIEPISQADSLRVIEEAGIAPVSYPTLNRRLPVFAKPAFRQALSMVCASHARLGPASLVLYDVSTLHFETDAGDGFREPGFSKERRLEPQINLGLLTDAAGYPLTVAAFEGNKAETATMVPVINEFKQAHRLTAGYRRAGPQGPACRRRARPRQPQPLHPTVRRHQVGQPHTGGQNPRAGRVEGIHHQPHRTACGVRHRRLPPAVAHREGVSDVQARPTGPADLPPHPRLHRGAPKRRVRSYGRITLD
jgi:hypothetical protein